MDGSQSTIREWLGDKKVKSAVFATAAGIISILSMIGDKSPEHMQTVREILWGIFASWFAVIAGEAYQKGKELEGTVPVDRAPSHPATGPAVNVNMGGPTIVPAAAAAPGGETVVQQDAAATAAGLPTYAEAMALLEKAKAQGFNPGNPRGGPVSH